IPACIEIGDPQVKTTLVLGMRLPNGHVALVYSGDGQHFTTEYDIVATGTTPVSLAVDGIRDDPYVAWSEADGTLKLAQVTPKVHKVIERPAPLDRESRHIGPAIQVAGGRLIYLWDDNIAWAFVQNIDRMQNPWPGDLEVDPQRGAHTGLGFFAPHAAPSLVTDGQRLFIGYRTQQVYASSNSMMVLQINAQTGRFEFLTGNDVISGEPKLYYWRGIGLYGTWLGPISEVRTSSYVAGSVRTVYYPYGIDDNELVNLGLFSSYPIGPSLFSIYLSPYLTLVNGRIARIRFHSVDRNGSGLNYDGW
ncbi:MAG: hypothetical protein ACRD1T_11165, partial [Acidimicrobiia bacterium]